MIFRLIPYLPLEIIAKVPNTEDGEISQSCFIDLLNEGQLLKMISH